MLSLKTKWSHTCARMHIRAQVCVDVRLFACRRRRSHIRVYLFACVIEAFVTRHGRRLSGSSRHPNNQLNEAYLLYAKLNAFKNRDTSRVRGSPKYQKNQLNDAHLLYAELKALTTRQSSRIRGSPKCQNAQALECILCPKN